MRHRRRGRESASRTAAQPEARTGATPELLVKELTLLRRVSKALAREREVGSILETAVAACREQLGFDHVIIATIEGDDLVGYGHEGLHETYARMPITAGIAARAVRTGISQLVRHAHADPDDVGADPGATMQSAIAVPITAAENVVGVLLIESDGAQTLESDDLHLAEVLADQVGVALERAQMDEERRTASERYRTMIDRSPAILYEVAQLRAGAPFRFISARVKDISGYPASAWEERPGLWHDLVHPDDRDRRHEALMRATRQGTLHDIEYRIVARDGRVRWMRERAASGIRADGSPPFWQGIVLDVSAYREVVSERALRAQAEVVRAEAVEARTQLARTLESITDGFIALDNDWRFTFLNRNAAFIARKEPQDLLGKVLWDEFPELVGSEFESCYRQAVTDRRPASVIAFYEPFQIWIDARIFPSETGMALYLRDVTEQRTAAEALQRSEDRYRALVEQLPAVTYLQPASGSGVLYISPQVEDLTGYSAERFVEDQNLWFAICHPDDVEQVRRAEIDADTFGTPVVETYRIIHADGRVIWVSDRAVPLRDPGSGEIHSWQGLTLDVTAQVTAKEARLRSSEAESASQAKSVFLSRMSHELRTPLNAILGFAQIMRADRLNDNQREGIDQILKAGRHLLSLINEALELSVIESGHIALSIEPIPLSEVVEEALALIAPLVKQADLTVRDGPWPVGAYVVADRQRLKQIVLNLLSNAIKYTPPRGTIAVRCDGIDARSIRLSIEDTGPGIPPEMMVRLFEPFDRLGVDHQAKEGSGLGLAVSQRLAEAMGLTINVDSTPGVGSRFWLELPLLVRSALDGERGAAGNDAD